MKKRYIGCCPSCATCWVAEVPVEATEHEISMAVNIDHEKKSPSCVADPYAIENL